MCHRANRRKYRGKHRGKHRGSSVNYRGLDNNGNDVIDELSMSRFDRQTIRTDDRYRFAPSHGIFPRFSKAGTDTTKARAWRSSGIAALFELKMRSLSPLEVDPYSRKSLAPSPDCPVLPRTIAITASRSRDSQRERRIGQTPARCHSSLAATVAQFLRPE